MKKVISVLSVILVLALCLSLAACGDSKDGNSADKTEAEKGISVGDTFKYGEGTIKLTEIEEGANSNLGDSGEAKGKWVSLHFEFGDDVGNVMIESEPFTLNGSKASNAVGAMVTKNDKLGLDLIVLFDIDKDADLDQLRLTVDK